MSILGAGGGTTVTSPVSRVGPYETRPTIKPEPGAPNRESEGSAAAFRAELADVEKRADDLRKQLALRKKDSSEYKNSSEYKAKAALAMDVTSNADEDDYAQLKESLTVESLTVEAPMEVLRAQYENVVDQGLVVDDLGLLRDDDTALALDIEAERVMWEESEFFGLDDDLEKATKVYDAAIAIGAIPCGREGMTLRSRVPNMAKYSTMRASVCVRKRKMVETIFQVNKKACAGGLRAVPADATPSGVAKVKTEKDVAPAADGASVAPTARLATPYPASPNGKTYDIQPSQRHMSPGYWPASPAFSVESPGLKTSPYGGGSPQGRG